MPDEPENLGLLAVLLQDSRRDAHVSTPVVNSWLGRTGSFALGSNRIEEGLRLVDAASLAPVGGYRCSRDRGVPGEGGGELIGGRLWRSTPN